MNDSTDIATIQAKIEWYLKKNYHGKIHAMNWEAVRDGSIRPLLFYSCHWVAPRGRSQRFGGGTSTLNCRLCA